MRKSDVEGRKEMTHPDDSASRGEDRCATREAGTDDGSKRIVQILGRTLAGRESIEAARLASEAESRRRTLAEISAAPDPDSFATRFDAILATMAGMEPEADLKDLADTAYEATIRSLEFDDMSRRVEYGTETIDAEMRRRCAAEMAGAYMNGIGSLLDESDIRSTLDRHVSISKERLETSPRIENGLILGRDLCFAVEDTLMLAVLQADPMNLCARIFGMEEDRTGPSIMPSNDPDIDLSEGIRTAFVGALVQDGAAAGFDAGVIEPIITAAFHETLAGSFGGRRGMLKHPGFAKLADPGIHRDERHRAATHLFRVTSSLLQVGCVLDDGSVPTYELAEQMADEVLERISHEKHATPLDAFETLCDLCLDISRTQGGSDSAFTQPVENETRWSGSIEELLDFSEPETILEVFGNGAQIAPPPPTMRCTVGMALAISGNVSPAAMGRIMSAFPKEGRMKQSLSGPAWLPEDKATTMTWREALKMAKALQAPTGVRIVIMLLDFDGRPASLVHDGRKAVLIKVGFTTPHAAIDHRGP